jgi:hypothetical protein
MVNDAVDIFPTLWYLSHYFVSGEYPIIHGSVIKTCYEKGLITKEQYNDLIEPLTERSYGRR